MIKLWNRLSEFVFRNYINPLRVSGGSLVETKLVSKTFLNYRQKFDKETYTKKVK